MKPLQSPSPIRLEYIKAYCSQTVMPIETGILLRGLYLFNPKQQEVVVVYFRNLVGSPFFNVDPNNQARAIKSTIPNNTDWAFSYELRLDLKKPLRLP